MLQPKHKTVKVKDDYRLIVVSDIHGHYDRFITLLKEVNYTQEDYLVILGDFIEKGDQVLDTIHFVQQLDRNERTFVLAGNCEWAINALCQIPELAGEIPKYLKRVDKNGCIRYVYNLLKLYDGTETTLGVQKRIREYLKDELDYLNQLYVTLKFNDFLFVHAGIEGKDYKKNSLSTLLEQKDFYTKGNPRDEIVVIGHMPTCNFKNDLNNDIILDLERRIICVDGGTGVKNVSQLNALIINQTNGVVHYSEHKVQPLPIGVINKNIVHEVQTIHTIQFPYYEIKILEKGEYFTLCEHIHTGVSMNIKNEFIYQRHDQTLCLDSYVDRMINAKKGDRIKIIGIYDGYTYASHNGDVGWLKNEDICIEQ